MVLELIEGTLQKVWSSEKDVYIHRKEKIITRGIKFFSAAKQGRHNESDSIVENFYTALKQPSAFIVISWDVNHIAVSLQAVCRLSNQGGKEHWT